MRRCDNSTLTKLRQKHLSQISTILQQMEQAKLIKLPSWTEYYMTAMLILVWTNKMKFTIITFSNTKSKSIILPSYLPSIKSKKNFLAFKNIPLSTSKKDGIFPSLMITQQESKFASFNSRKDRLICVTVLEASIRAFLQKKTTNSVAWLKTRLPSKKWSSEYSD